MACLWRGRGESERDKTSENERWEQVSSERESHKQRPQVLLSPEALRGNDCMVHLGKGPQASEQASLCPKDVMETVESHQPCRRYTDKNDGYHSGNVCGQPDVASLLSHLPTRGLGNSEYPRTLTLTQMGWGRSPGKTDKGCQDYCTCMCWWPTQKHLAEGCGYRLGETCVFPVPQALYLEEEAFCDLLT